MCEYLVMWCAILNVHNTVVLVMDLGDQCGVEIQRMTRFMVVLLIAGIVDVDGAIMHGGISNCGVVGVTLCIVQKFDATLCFAMVCNQP